MKIPVHNTDATTGEVSTVWLDIADGEVVSVEEATERDRLQAIRNANAEIQAQLAANDLNVIRAIVEGDTQRIKAHAASQAELRKKIKPVQ